MKQALELKQQSQMKKLYKGEDFGFNLNFKIENEDIPVRVKVGFGNDIQVDAKRFDKNKYLSLSLTAEF